MLCSSDCILYILQNSDRNDEMIALMVAATPQRGNERGVIADSRTNADWKIVVWLLYCDIIYSIGFRVGKSVVRRFECFIANLRWRFVVDDYSVIFISDSAL
ncbi:hypothetical protein DN068_03500 [Taibaiella soli]|uniref:Uncharacterized protein n=1 Tax=Taibaiella soli TaxID=1649169 RepID=A0A2W2AGP1_9BACT|nr:hypothetical protein DN068_03500 [Taibaiella soli]